MRTQQFQVATDVYLGIVARQWWGRWWPVAALTVLSIAAVGILLSDVRMAFVAAIVIFLVLPMSLIPIYSHALTREAAISATQKVVESAPDGLSITLIPDDSHPLDGQILIPWPHIRGLSFTKRHFVFRLEGKYAYLPVPYSAFADKEELRQFSKEVHSALTKGQPPIS